MTISVVIPCYNCSDTIINTLESVFNQTKQPKEIICVDDGSTDTTPQLLESVKNKITILSQHNSGVSSARNKAIEIVSSEYIAFLDSDDIWKPHHLATLSKVAETGEYSIIGSSYYKQKIHDHARTPALSFPDKSDESKILNFLEYCKLKAKNQRVFWTSAVMVPTELVRELGGFRTSYTHGEDQALWLQLMTQGNGIKLSNITAVYLQREGSLSKKVPTKKDAIIELIDELLISGFYVREQTYLKQMQRQYCLSHVKNSILANNIAMSKYYYRKYSDNNIFLTILQFFIMNRLFISIVRMYKNARD